MSRLKVQEKEFIKSLLNWKINVKLYDLNIS